LRDETQENGDLGTAGNGWVPWYPVGPPSAETGVPHAAIKLPRTNLEGYTCEPL